MMNDKILRGIFSERNVDRRGVLAKEEKTTNGNIVSNALVLSLSSCWWSLTERRERIAEQMPKFSPVDKYDRENFHRADIDWPVFEPGPPCVGVRRLILNRSMLISLPLSKVHQHARWPDPFMVFLEGRWNIGLHNSDQHLFVILTGTDMHLNHDHFNLLH